MTIHRIFPTAIGEYFYDDHQKYNNIFLQNIEKYCIKKNNKLYSGESTGFNAIHTEPLFVEGFKFIVDAFRTYCDELNFDSSVFDIVITKTWLNILHDNMSTPDHVHETSHYSFVYYIDVPKNSDMLCFALEKSSNEPFHGAFYDYTNTNWKKLVTNYTDLNSIEWSFEPKNGKLFVFPSHLRHYTKKVGTIQNEKRVAVSGDVFFVYKENTNPNYPTGIFPVSQWRTFE